MKRSYPRKKTTKINLIFHYISLFITIGRGFLIVPLYLKFINHDLYGAWLASGAILVWLSIVDPGLGNVLQQKIATSYSQKNKYRVENTISSGILSALIIALLALIISTILSDYLPMILNLSESIDKIRLINVFRIAAIGTCLSIFSFGIVGINQGLQSSLGIGWIYNITNLVSIVITIFLLFSGFGLYSIAYSNLFRGIGYILGNGSYLIWRMKSEELNYSFNKKFFFSFSKLYSYTFLSKLFKTISNNLDLILVARFINPITVMQLELTRRPVKIVTNFAKRPSVAFMPTIAHLFGENDTDKTKKIVIRFFNTFSLFIYLIIFGFITFNSDLIRLWLGDNIFIGNKANILICTLLFFQSITYSFYNFSFSLGNIKGNSIVQSIRSVISILLLFILGKYFGLWGILIAPLIAIILTEFWYYPQKLFQLIKLKKKEIGIFIKNNLSIIFLCTFISIIFINISVKSWIELSFLTILFSFIYLIVLWSIYDIFRNEIKKMALIIKIQLRLNKLKIKKIIDPE